MEIATDRRTAVLIDEEYNVLRLSWEGAEPKLDVVLRDTSGSVVAAGGPGGAFIATSDRSSVSLYMGGDRPTRTWQTEVRVEDLAVSPDGRRVAAGLRSGEVLVWDVGSEELLARLVGHRERVSAVWFSPDGSELLTGSWDETLRLWNMSALDLPDDALVRQVEARWGRSAEEALAESSRL
jgi:WD40 repeat protein